MKSSLAVLFVLFFAWTLNLQAKPPPVEVMTLEPLLFELGVTDRVEPGRPLRPWSDLWSVLSPEKFGSSPAVQMMRQYKYPFESFQVSPDGRKALVQISRQVKSDRLDPDRDAAVVDLDSEPPKVLKIVRITGSEKMSLVAIGFVSQELVRLTYVVEQGGIDDSAESTFVHWPWLFDLKTQRRWSLESLLARATSGHKMIAIKALTSQVYPVLSASLSDGRSRLSMYRYDGLS